MNRNETVDRRAAWVAGGVLAGIASVIACGGPDTVDAGGTDAGAGTGCCDCTCTVPDPLTLQGSIDANITNSTPIEVSVAAPVTVEEPIDVNVVSPVPLLVDLASATPLSVAVSNAVPIDVNVTTPITAAPAATPTFRGVTTATFTGAGGYASMNAACNADFPGSRMCSTTLLLDLYPAPIPGVDAWVWSRVAASGPSHGLNEISLAGYGNTASINCSFFGPPFSSATTSFDGTIITAAGSIDPADCFGSRVVACCGYLP